MRISHLVVISLAIGIAASDASSSVHKPPVRTRTGTGHGISYQVHSWNDLREWRQGFMKGMNWLKIDLNYVTQDQCPPGYPAGCFLLTHNDPDVTQRKYNTSDDVITLLNDPTYAPYLKGNTTIYIALCFKYGGNKCDGSQESKNWISLVTDFSNKLEALTKVLNLGIVMDCSGCPDWCYLHFWPWPATWGGGPWDALNSNNYTLGYDQFQVLDVPSYPILDPGYWIQYLAPYKFGKFLDVKYPWLFYELADQGSIQKLGEAYLDSGFVHPAGIRSAINIDPIQFEVYAADQTQQAWNQYVNSVASEPHVIVIATAPSKLVILYTFNIKGSLYYQVATARSMMGKVAYGSQNTLPSALTTITTLNTITINSINAVNTTTVVFATDDGGRFTLMGADGAYQLHNLMDGKMLPSDDGDTIKYSTATALWSSSSQSIRIFQVYTTNNSDCGLRVQVWMVKPPFTQAVRVGSGWCVVQGMVPPNATIAVAPTSKHSNCTLPYEGLVFYGSDDRKLYGATLCVDALTGKVDGANSHGATPSQLDVGTSPSASIIASGGDVYVMTVHGEGYCFNSDWHNKRGYPAVCDAEPHSSPFILVYNYGNLEDWKQRIINNKIITSCDDAFLHGMYDEGTRPSVALFSTKFQTDKIAMLEVHEGLNDEVVDQAGCGWPTPKPGVVMDSWHL